MANSCVWQSGARSPAGLWVPIHGFWEEVPNIFFTSKFGVKALSEFMVAQNLFKGHSFNLFETKQKFLYAARV